MEYKYPIEYELDPKNSLEKGTHWMTLKIKNVGVETIRKLDVKLHSTDTYNLSVYGEGDYISELRHNEEREVVTRILVNGSTYVYATISAQTDEEYFGWESRWIHISLAEEKAELISLFVLSHPYTSVGKTLEVEATIKGLQKSEGLKLEFWTETPSGRYEELGKIEIKELIEGEEAKYSTEITTKETGFYEIKVCLYDKRRRIGYKTNMIYVN